MVAEVALLIYVNYACGADLPFDQVYKQTNLT